MQPLTGSELLTALHKKFTVLELRDLIAAKRLNAEGSIIKSTMRCLHEIYDEVILNGDAK